MNLKANREAIPTCDPLSPCPIDDKREAIGELFLRSQARLYKTALRIVGNPEDAEDALQDGLLSAFRNLCEFEGRSQLSTWLTRIVVNSALMKLRRRHPEAVTSIDERLHLDDEPLADRLPAPGPNPEEIYRQREQLQLLERVLGTLPASYQHALRLCHVQGLKIREAAEITGTSAGTFKSQLWRARDRLRKEVAATRKTRRGASQQSAAGELTRELWPSTVRNGHRTPYYSSPAFWKL